MDFLTDDLKIPTLVFLNCRLTYNGIVPEIGFIGSGKYDPEYDMFDKHGVKCCRLKTPQFLVNGFVVCDQCFFANTTEFIITKVYYD